jgi:hypothetical protein
VEREAGIAAKLSRIGSRVLARDHRSESLRGIADPEAISPR